MTLMGVIEIIAIVLILSWIGGLILHVAGGLINILLLVAVILFVYRFFTRKTI